MELKTKVNTVEGKQEIIVTREFDLPVELLFKAYEDPEILAQWMGTKIVKFEFKQHGSYRFETSDPQGNVVFSANGTIHEVVPNQKIIRTFQMENTSFDAQLEFLDFERVTENSSRLVMHMVFRSVENKNQLLKMPFAQGLNMAHDRLQQILNKIK